MTATTAAAVSIAPSRLRAPWLAGGILAVVIAVVVGVAVGPVGISPVDVVRELLSHVPLLGVHSDLSARDAAIITELRLPRVVLALLVGALLSIAGASYQGTFRNPLADPYLLGAGAGAGLMVTLAIVTSTATLGGSDQLVPLAAFIGAFGAVVASYLIGRSAGGVAVVTLVLAGVAISSFLTAIQAYLLQRNSDNIREVYTWILGRLTVASWTEVALVLPYFVVSVVVLLMHRRVLDVLAVGEDEASTLGIPVAASRLVIVAAASLATAAAVAVSGLIGFVGIIVAAHRAHGRRDELSRHPPALGALRRRVPRVRRSPRSNVDRPGRAPDRCHHRVHRRAVLPRRALHEPAGPRMSAIRIDGLVVELGDHRILDGIDLDVADGSWVSIVGPNGAGKTTLVRTVAGLVKPHAGRVEVDGVATHALRACARARLLALVPQAPVIPVGVSVLDYAPARTHTPRELLRSGDGGRRRRVPHHARATRRGRARRAARRDAVRRRASARRTGPRRCSRVPRSCCSTSRRPRSTSAISRMCSSS